jgi:hypothetical protein
MLLPHDVRTGEALVRPAQRLEPCLSEVLEREPVPLLRLPCDPIADSELVPAHELHSLGRALAALCAHPRITPRILGWVGGWPLWALKVSTASPRLRVVVTAGIHGVEPAGPAAVVLFLEELLAAPLRHEGVELLVLPLVNPVGYHSRVRGNADHVDLNRAFGAVDEVPREVALVRTALDEGPFDLGVDLHSSRSSGRRGWFSLHRGALALLGPAMRRFGERYPILGESTERYVLDAPGVLRSANRGTLKDHLADRGVRWAVTIEAPAAMAYPTQVVGSADILHTLLETALALG